MIKKISLSIAGVVVGLVILYLFQIFGAMINYPDILGIPYYPFPLILIVIILVPTVYWVLTKSK